MGLNYIIEQRLKVPFIQVLLIPTPALCSALDVLGLSRVPRIENDKIMLIGFFI